MHSSQQREMHPSQQMPPAHHGNQQGPAGAPGTGQPPYYHN
jgi:polypyrimidine tract-binding protein 2